MEQDKAPRLSLLVDPVGSTPTDGSTRTGLRSDAYTRVEQQLVHVMVPFASHPREAALSLHTRVVVVVVVATNVATGVATPTLPPSRQGGLLPAPLHAVQLSPLSRAADCHLGGVVIVSPPPPRRRLIGVWVVALSSIPWHGG